MLGTMFVFFLIVPIAIIGLVTAALPMALIFAFAFTLNFAVAITITVMIPVSITIPVSILVPASFPIAIVMSGGVVSVTVLGKHRKGSEGAGAHGQNQGPCKLP